MSVKTLGTELAALQDALALELKINEESKQILLKHITDHFDERAVALRSLMGTVGEEETEESTTKETTP